jgi:hypothetical protein
MGQRSILSFGRCGAGMLVLALAGCAELADVGAPPVRQRSARSASGPTTSRPPRSSAGAPAIVLSSATGAPGQTVSFTATLRTGGASVAGAQNDVTFDAVHTPVVAKSAGKPQCAPNRAIGKDATAFAFRPSKCAGAKCTGMRALVLSLSDVRPIADGAVLYTCTVRIPRSAQPGTYPLAISAVSLSTPDGREVPAATGVAGTITVTGQRR